jgi:hypothetical protein
MYFRYPDARKQQHPKRQHPAFYLFDERVTYSRAYFIYTFFDVLFYLYIRALAGRQGNFKRKGL